MKFYVHAETSDREFTVTLSVSHPKKDLKQFQKDWAKCSEKVCAIDYTVNPVNTCEEQYRLMKKRGWKIKELDIKDTVLYS